MSNAGSSPVAGLFKWAAVVSILAVALAFLKEGSAVSDRAVMISSDDSGMCPSANRGAIEALQAGIVKSTSIMACCPAFDEFAAFARSHPEYDYGVHLTLTCDLRQQGWGPVLPAAEVPSLVANDGFLHATTRDVAQYASLTEIEAELRAQIRKTQGAGIRITHLDHHMWVLYAREDFLRLYVKLGREFNLPIRFPREVPRQMSSPGATTAFLEQRQIVEQAGYPILDQIEAANYSIPAARKRAYFLNELRNLKPGVTEFVIHCASPDESKIEPPDAEARYADTTTFTASEIREELQSMRVEIIDWKSLTESRRKRP